MQLIYVYQCVIPASMHLKYVKLYCFNYVIFVIGKIVQNVWANVGLILTNGLCMLAQSKKYLPFRTIGLKRPSSCPIVPQKSISSKNLAKSAKIKFCSTIIKIIFNAWLTGASIYVYFRELIIFVGFQSH